MGEWVEDDPLIIVRGEGNELIDDRGRRYIDGVASLWVNIHGHARPEIDRAIAEQLGRIAHTTMLGLTSPPAIELADALLSIAPRGLSRVFYSDDGSTAVEVALKLALQYWRQRRPDPRPERTGFIALRHAYHGDTIGAVSLGGIERFHEIFRPLLFPVERAESAYCYRCALGLAHPACGLACAESVGAILQRTGERIAAIVIEPAIQGAGGMIAFPSGFTRRVVEIARAHGVLVIADEVATGFGRTGRMFACEREGIEPDILALAKGITGGYLPLAATLATEEIHDAFLGRSEELRTFFHGHSYTGNAAACAAALASLAIFRQEDTLARVRIRAAELERLLAPLRDHPHVGDIRQAGLMAGIEIVRDRATREPFPAAERVGVRVARAGRARGVILRPLGDVIVILPPLSIRADELARIVDAVAAGLREVTGR
ncbi:MAG: adenosylmethionine--8-amino-7-oxononanoate transaminase [Planctomycetes bacterium]|nr:adenosylmethionine--8-amino-7-oxononanoate transaminase [Planctomycetota bacterium]